MYDKTTKSFKGLTKQQKARKSLIYYLIAVFALSTPLYLLIFLTGRSVYENQILIILLMWTPAAASLVIRLIRKEGFRGIGFTLRGRSIWKSIGIALLFPLIVGFLSYGGAWLTGLAEFRPLTTGQNPVIGLLTGVAKAVTVATLFGIVIVTGEEIGWRGYMTGKLMESGWNAPNLIGGLIWSLWHTPLILSGQYTSGPYPIVSALTFAVLAVALHSLWSRWRILTGSLWPAIIAHSAWNSVIQNPFDGHTGGEGAFLWLGDSGLLVVSAAAILITVFTHAKEKRSQTSFERLAAQS